MGMFSSDKKKSQTEGLPRRHAERVATFHARRSEIAAAKEAALAKLHTEAVTVQAKASSEDEAVRRAETEAQAAMEHALARDFFAEIGPLVAAFPDRPRSTAIEIAATMKALAARSREELGDDLDERLLGMAFARFHGVEARAGARVFWEHGLEAAHRAVKTLLSSALAPEIESALRELELEVVRRAQVVHPELVSEARAQIISSFASRVGNRTACEAFDEQKENA